MKGYPTLMRPVDESMPKPRLTAEQLRAADLRARTAAWYVQTGEVALPKTELAIPSIRYRLDDPAM